MKRVININLPGSKSITQRALILAALANSPSIIKNASDCDDCETMISALTGMNIIFEKNDNSLTVKPAKLIAPNKIIYCNNCGTCARFISALSLLINGKITLDGDARMRERPMKSLIDAISVAGVECNYLDNIGNLPITLTNISKIKNDMEVCANESSQFVSALALVGAKLKGGMTLKLINQDVSSAYVSLTLDILRIFGINAHKKGNIINIPETSYPGKVIAVEPDMSLAPYFIVASDILNAEINFENMQKESAQGDAIFAKYYNKIKYNEETQIDLSATPDLLPPIAAAALFYNKKVEITNVKHARSKESDRVAAIVQELTKIGAKCAEREDGIAIYPNNLLDNKRIKTYNDHRLAMMFGVISLFVKGIEIENKECVSKSFPQFWSELHKLK